MPTPLTASVRGQLRFAFAIVITLSFLSTALAIWRLQMLSDDTNELTHRPLAKERLVSSWLLNISMSAKRTAELQKQVGEMLDTPEEKALFEQIGQARQEYIASRDRVMALKAEGKADEARSLYEQSFAGIMDGYIARVKELLALQQKTIDTRASEVLASARHSSSVLVALFQVEAAAAPAAAKRPSPPAVKPAPATARPAQARGTRKPAPAKLAKLAAVAEDWEEF